VSTTVLDANGVELHEGAEVRRPGFSMNGTIQGIDWLGSGEVYVSWPGQPFGLPFWSRRRFTARRTYRCAHLEAQPQSEGTKWSGRMFADRLLGEHLLAPLEAEAEAQQRKRAEVRAAEVADRESGKLALGHSYEATWNYHEGLAVGAERAAQLVRELIAGSDR
jgi:hypothetical protein